VIIEKEVGVIEMLKQHGFSPAMFVFPDADQRTAKQAAVLEDFEQNNRRYSEYVRIEMESNRYVKECLRELEEQFTRNTKQIGQLNQEIEKAEAELKEYLTDNGIKAKELIGFIQFDAAAAQALIDRKVLKQNQKLR
jgi:hypothetical protein